MNVREESDKIEQAGVPGADEGVAGEPQEDVEFTPVTTDTGTTYTRPFGLILTVEVGRPGVDNFGDLLNVVAAAWRGREELRVKPGDGGGIKNSAGAPVGLWLIDYA